MPDNSTLPATGDIIAADEISGVKFQRIKLVLGADGVNAGDVASGNPMPVQASALPLPTGAATEATLAAVSAKLPTLSSGRVPVELPAGGSGLTNSELRATPVPVSGTFWQATQPVSFTWAGLTDAQLRASAVPVSGTFWQATQPVSFTWAGLTDSQLRASAVPVSGPLTDTQLRATAVPVSGPLTDAQLRASNINTTLAALTYPASTNNSSVAQLGAAASFTGTVETIQNQQSAQISVVCDQAYTVQVQQFIDAGGTQLVSTDTFTRAAGVALNENITLPGDFFRVVLTNNGGSTTTTLRLSTTFGIMGTQPRALTNEGRLPVDAAPPAALLSSYTVAGVIAINTILLALDCSQHRSVSVQCVSMGTTGAVTPEWSNDNTNWQAATIFTAAGVSATTFNAAGLWTVPVAARYLRLRLSTATTAGTTTLSVHRFDDGVQPWLATQAVSGTVTANQGTMVALPAGTNAVGDVGMQYRANATGAASLVAVMSPATPAVGTIKASAGRLVGWQLQNSSAGLRSVKIFNATAPTLGTTAAVFEIDIPAGGRTDIENIGGVGFATAITWSVTSAKGLTDNTATGLAANDVSGSFFFA